MCFVLNTGMCVIAYGQQIVHILVGAAAAHHPVDSNVDCTVSSDMCIRVIIA